MTELTSMETTFAPIGPDEPFRFSCNPEVACFNECCRDLNQALTPYDVLRLRRCLNLSSAEFLGRYARRHTGPASGLPVVSLIPADRQQLACPFVTPAGCRVYPDRPSSCRSYPLVRVVRRARADGEAAEAFMLLREPHCRGFEEPQPQTPRAWAAGQGLAEYNSENDRLLELIGLKERLSPKALPPSLGNEIFTALYDLDRLRAQLMDGRLAGLRAQEVASAAADPVALLRLGLKRARGLLERAFAR